MLIKRAGGDWVFSGVILGILWAVFRHQNGDRISYQVEHQSLGHWRCVVLFFLFFFSFIIIIFFGFNLLGGRGKFHFERVWERCWCFWFWFFLFQFFFLPLPGSAHSSRLDLGKNTLDFLICRLGPAPNFTCRVCKIVSKEGGLGSPLSSSRRLQR